MKKKFGILFLSFLLTFLFLGCDEVLSVVTVNEDGEKVVNNYVSVIGNKVYDESISIKSWQEIDIFNSESPIDMDNLLFKIENKKEKIVVYGDEDSAVEITFFDGGYKYNLYASANSLSNSFDSLSDF